MSKGFLGYLLERVLKPKPAKAERTQRLAQAMAIGSKLFGSIPPGHEREFYYLGNHLWVWNERWQAKDGKNIAITTQYTAENGRVLKTQNGQTYELQTGEELTNLVNAVRQYCQQVATRVYTQSIQFSK